MHRAFNVGSCPIFRYGSPRVSQTVMIRSCIVTLLIAAKADSPINAAGYHDPRSSLNASRTESIPLGLTIFS